MQGELGGGDVVAEIGEARRVGDRAGARRRIVVRSAVLGDQERDVSVVPFQADEQLVERVGHDLPAHAGRGERRRGAAYGDRPVVRVVADDRTR